MSMTTRATDLQTFFDRLEISLRARLEPGPALSLTETIFKGLRQPAGRGEVGPQRLPVCAYLDTAYGLARKQDPATAALTEAFRAIEPQLDWERRWNAKPSDGAFYDGHANANIVGPEGIEKRDDIWIGVSLVAPGITYPDHHHPPEEVYVVLSPGEWKHGGSDWFAPGYGGLVYNVSDTVHAMRAGPEPLLAIWSLWVGGKAGT